MPDSPSSGNKIGPPKEMSMETRLLLALLLTVPIVFLAPYFLGNQQPPAAVKKSAPVRGATDNPAAHTSAQAPAAAPAAASAPATGPTSAQTPLPDFVIN